MSGIPKETLRMHLRNTPLVRAIAQKNEIDQTRKKLCEARTVMQETKISDTAQREIQQKIDEYGKISHNYGNMIQDTWSITWQVESIIERFLDSCDDDIDKLPDVVRF